MFRGSNQRWLLVLAVVVIAIGVPASAADRFDDVAATNTHREAIEELVESGITLGCDPGRYCPQELVRRDQMASFLTRTGSRTVSHEGVASLAAGDGVPASVTIRATGAPGGQATVSVQGSVSVYATGNLTACPCEVEAFVYRDSDDAQGPSSWAQLPDVTNGSDRSVTSLPVSWAFEIPSGATETYRLAVFIDGELAEVHAEGALTAIATPLG